VKLHAKPGWVCYTVQDSGSGIPKEYQDKIFETFFRAPSPNGHTVKGHGLGLSYAAKVVQEHGGRIFLESSGAEGSVFTVELPAHV
jgi:two-component system, OmpR family, phosphate regulon sensor histidine kinase PhoR